MHLYEGWGGGGGVHVYGSRARIALWQCLLSETQSPSLQAAVNCRHNLRLTV